MVFRSCSWTSIAIVAPGQNFSSMKKLKTTSIRRKQIFSIIFRLCGVRELLLEKKLFFFYVSGKKKTLFLKSSVCVTLKLFLGKKKNTTFDLDCLTTLLKIIQFLFLRVVHILPKQKKLGGWMGLRTRMFTDAYGRVGG